MYTNFKSKIFVAFFVFTSSLIAFFKQFLIAKFLIPIDYGIYSKYFIVSTFAISFGALGLYYKTIYKVSQNIEKASLDIDRYKNELLWGYIYFSPFLIFALFFILKFSRFYDYFILFLFCSSQILFTITYLSLNLQDSLKFSKKLFYKNIFSLIPVLFVTYYLKNLYFAIILESLLIITLITYWKDFSYIIKYNNFKQILLLYKQSVSYLMVVLTGTLLFFIVRIIASNQLLSVDLGVYFLGFTLVIIGSQFQYLFSVILNPIFSKKSRNNDFTTIYVLFTWLITMIISIVVYFLIYLSKDLFFEFFPKYIDIKLIYIPFCVLGIAKMTEIFSIYFILDGKQKYSTYSNLFCILVLIIFSSLNWNTLRTLQGFVNFIYIESVLVIIFPFIFYLLSRSNINFYKIE
jgi:hypothetical protein